MKRTFKRLLCLLLVFLTLTSGMMGLTASAATAIPSISSSKYITCYTQKDYSSNQIQAYSNSSLKTRTGGYIAISTDQCRILAFSSDGRAVKVRYPVKGGTKTAWFYRSHFFSRDVYKNGVLGTVTASKTITVYRWKANRLDGTKNRSIGSISKGDKVYILDGGGSNAWTQVLYPVTSNGTWKMGWVKTNQLTSVPATKVTLNSTSATLYVGNQKTLKATLAPAHTTDKVKSWVSSNTSVATVSSGVVTAKATGSATITVTTTSGKTATCKITVKPRSSEPKTESKTIVSPNEISAAAKKYGISASSNAYKALQSINTKYASKLYTSRNGTLVFMFEGVGSSSKSSLRMNAMCVVVKNGKIVYINRNCSTIPDYPFNPSKNDGDPMPTIKSGIYNFSSKNHQGKYAALNVSSAKVLRFSSKSSYYSSTSYGINVHARSSNNIARASATWVNSAGCLLIGNAASYADGKLVKHNSAYVTFCQKTGIIKSSRSTMSGTTKYDYKITGKIIIDRTYAKTYLQNVGYSNAAITALG